MQKVFCFRDLTLEFLIISAKIFKTRLSSIESKPKKIDVVVVFVIVVDVVSVVIVIISGLAKIGSVIADIYLLLLLFLFCGCCCRR